VNSRTSHSHATESRDRDSETIDSKSKDKDKSDDSNGQNVDHRSDPIAIVGIGCRFPGSVNDPDSFWSLVESGRDGIVEVPENRWLIDRFYDSDPDRRGKMYVRHAAFLDQNYDEFDAMFFGISPREAELMDPQQRLLLEVSWEALENAGIAPESIAGTRVGVYVGGFMIDNQVTQLGLNNRDNITIHTPVSSTLTMLSNRLSYFFNFTGPSISVDTACSSSLVAMHYACEGLIRGECSMALVGGSNAIFRPEAMVSMCKGQFLSSDGRSKSFDARADGYGRGEGAGIIVLKRLSKALADKNPVYAIVRGTGVNQDGRTNGITVPNPESQKALIRKVGEDAGVSASEVGYVEAHGTGTPVGDPIEAGVLGEMYGANRGDTNRCAIGSVKANIGHQEAAAGVAGVIKAALSLHHRIVGPVANLGEPNPDIPFDDLGLALPREAYPMKPNSSGSRLAAINSFGYGGTNAHTILEQYSDPGSEKACAASKSETGKVRKRSVLTLSGRSENALNAVVAQYIELLKSDGCPEFSHICYSTNQHRGHHEHRLALVTEDRGEAVKSLDSFLNGESAVPNLRNARNQLQTQARPVFVYSGMGPQWWAMGQELFANESVYRVRVQECDEVFRQIAGWSILEQMLLDENESRITETQFAQPANFVLQMGLTELLASRGVYPSAVVGHSVGEVTSAFVSGVLTLEEAMTVSYHRSRLQKKAAGQGSMLAVGLSETQYFEYLAHIDSGAESVSIAAINGGTNTTLAGDDNSLRELAALLDEKEIFNRFLDVEVPYHSHYMEPLKTELAESLRALRPTVPDIPLFSTVTGQAVTEPSYDGSYWCENIREPVQFSLAMQSIIAAGHELFLEVGPHPVLSASVNDCLNVAGVRGEVVPSLRRKTDELEAINGVVTELYCRGAQVDWSIYTDASLAQFVKLPPYPWQRQKYWSESEYTLIDRVGSDAHPLTFLKHNTATPRWVSQINNQALPFLDDHIVDGVVVFPGASYVECALSVAAELGYDRAIQLTDISFQRALVFGEEEEKLAIEVDPKTSRFDISSRNVNSDWISLATGTLSKLAPFVPRATVDLASLQKQCLQELDIADFYAKLEKRGLKYGEHFRRIESASLGDNKILARISGLASDKAVDRHYRMHPTLLDSCFQSLVSLISDKVDDVDTFVPTGIDQVSYYGDPLSSFWSLGNLRDTRSARETEQAASRGNPSADGIDAMVGDVTMFDDAGNVLARLTGIRLQVLSKAERSIQKRLPALVYESLWEPTTAMEPVAQVAPVLVVSANTETGNWISLGFEKSTTSEMVLVQPHSDSKQPARLNGADNNQSNLKSDEEWTSVLENAQQCSSVLYDATVEVDTQANDGSRILECWGKTIESLRRLAMAIDRGFESVPRRLYVLIRDCARVTDADRVDGLMQSPLIGLARVIFNEFPALKCSIIDIDASKESLDALLTEIASESDDDAIAIRNGDRYVQRLGYLSKLQKTNEVQEELAEVDADEAYELEVGLPGVLDTLNFRRVDRAVPAENQIEIKVRATALNFKDVAKAMNILGKTAMDDTFHGVGLGLEAAGTVVRVGKDVHNVKAGDNLAFTVQGCFRRYATIDDEPHLYRKIEDDVTFAEAASSPTVFMTAYHALHNVARLTPNDTVLIHAATGGVGLAAIQVARWAGAKIIATAGSDEKRNYLHSIGIEHVSDSRSLQFVQDVKTWTDNKGVDVVLNSLSGELINKSLEVLAPFGRMVELGKKDLVEGGSLSLTAFNNSLSFCAVDLDRMLGLRPDLTNSLLDDIGVHFANKTFRPLPLSVYPAADVSEAFKFMGRARHMGKVVIDFDAQPSLPVLPLEQKPQPFKPDATYLITGGCSGFGLGLAKRMVEPGSVRHLVLASRSGVNSDDARQAMRDFEKAGVNLKVIKADVSCAADVEAMIKLIESEMPPLKGIYHAAAVLDDDLLTELDIDRFCKVLRPKALGAWNLHESTKNLKLDQFVLFSSFSAVIGNTRQGNYVSANLFLDTLAHFRHARGLAATSINWGAIADVGMAARNEATLKLLESMGVGAMSVADSLVAMEEVMDFKQPQLGIGEMDWATWAQVEPVTSSSPRFAQLVKSSGESADTIDRELIEQLSALDIDQQHEMMALIISEQISSTLRIPVDNIDTHVSLVDLGMDSLLAVELQTGIRQRFGIELSTLELMKEDNVENLSVLLVRKLDLGDADFTAKTIETVPVVDEVKASHVDVDSLSEDLVDDLLESMVEQGVA